MRRAIWVLLAAVVCAWAFACDDGGGDGDGDTDTDADTDTDTDADTDADGDGDGGDDASADADAGGDADADGGVDAAVDADVDTGADAAGDADAEGDAGADADATADATADADTDGGADADAMADADQDGGADADTDAGADADGDTCTSLAGLVIINELMPNEPGTDSSSHYSFVELRGVDGTVLDGAAIVHINGSSGAELARWDLTGAIPADGLFVIGESDVPNLDQTVTMDLQNGPDNVLLVDGCGDTIDAVGYAVFDVDEYFVGEGSSIAFTGENTIGRCPTADLADADSDDNSADFVDMDLSPAEPYSNAGLPNPACT